ncbi:hypothetical protein AB1Y20_022444 [Prymnesium parvum]|uniref:Uncharacterized protein n=1 Tax=Prymnesium parvum TaxID=97485 RepID=A0AB34JIU9_PRYPA
MRLSLVAAAMAAWGVESTELHEACARAELRHVVRLARSEPHLLDMLDENGLTALMMAAQRGLDVIAQALLDAGASINLRGLRQMTALHHATIQRRLLVVQLLLARNANPNMQMDDGRTPLHYAAGCCPELVHELLRHAANPNMATPRCTTPLHMALMSLVSTPAQPPRAALRDQLLQIVDQLVAGGAQTGLRTLTAPLISPRGVSAREMVEKTEPFDPIIKARLDEMMRAWPPAPPMPCTELARKVVYTSFRPRGEAAEGGEAAEAAPRAGGLVARLVGVEGAAALALLALCGLLVRRWAWRREKGGKAKKGAKGGKGAAKGGKAAKGASRGRDAAAAPRDAKPAARGGEGLQRRGGAAAAGGGGGGSMSGWRAKGEGAQGGSGYGTSAARESCGSDDEEGGEDGGEEGAEHDCGGWEGVGERARAKNEERRLRREQLRQQEPADALTPNGLRWRGGANGTSAKAGKGSGASGSLHGLAQEEEMQVAMALSLSMSSDSAAAHDNHSAGYGCNDVAGASRGARTNGSAASPWSAPSHRRADPRVSAKPLVQRALTISDVEPRQRGELAQRGEPLSSPRSEPGVRRAYSDAVQGISKPQMVNALDAELCALILALRGDKGLGKRVDGPLDLLEAEQERYELGKIEREQFMRCVREVVGEEKLARIQRSIKAHARESAKTIPPAIERER